MILRGFLLFFKKFPSFWRNFDKNWSKKSNLEFWISNVRKWVRRSLTPNPKNAKKCRNLAKFHSIFQFLDEFWSKNWNFSLIVKNNFWTKIFELDEPKPSHRFWQWFSHSIVILTVLTCRSPRELFDFGLRITRRFLEPSQISI